MSTLLNLDIFHSWQRERLVSLAPGRDQYLKILSPLKSSPSGTSNFFHQNQLIGSSYVFLEKEFVGLGYVLRGETEKSAMPCLACLWAPRKQKDFIPTPPFDVARDINNLMIFHRLFMKGEINLPISEKINKVLITSDDKEQPDESTWRVLLSQDNRDHQIKPPKELFKKIDDTFSSDFWSKLIESVNKKVNLIVDAPEQEKTATITVMIRMLYYFMYSENKKPLWIVEEPANKSKRDDVDQFIIALRNRYNIDSILIKSGVSGGSETPKFEISPMFKDQKLSELKIWGKLISEKLLEEDKKRKKIKFAWTNLRRLGAEILSYGEEVVTEEVIEAAFSTIKLQDASFHHDFEIVAAKRVKRETFRLKAFIDGHDKLTPMARKKEVHPKYFLKEIIMKTLSMGEDVPGSHQAEKLIYEKGETIKYVDLAGINLEYFNKLHRLLPDGDSWKRVIGKFCEKRMAIFEKELRDDPKKMPLFIELINEQIDKLPSLHVKTYKLLNHNKKLLDLVTNLDKNSDTDRGEDIAKILNQFDDLNARFIMQLPNSTLKYLNPDTIFNASLGYDSELCRLIFHKLKKDEDAEDAIDEIARSIAKRINEDSSISAEYLTKQQPEILQYIDNSFILSHTNKAQLIDLIRKMSPLNKKMSRGLLTTAFEDTMGHKLELAYEFEEDIKEDEDLSNLVKRIFFKWVQNAESISLGAYEDVELLKRFNVLDDYFDEFRSSEWWLQGERVSKLDENKRIALFFDSFLNVLKNDGQTIPTHTSPLREKFDVINLPKLTVDHIEHVVAEQRSFKDVKTNPKHLRQVMNTNSPEGDYMEGDYKFVYWLLFFASLVYDDDDPEGMYLFINSQMKAIIRPNAEPLRKYWKDHKQLIYSCALLTLLRHSSKFQDIILELSSEEGKRTFELYCKIKGPDQNTPELTAKLYANILSYATNENAYEYLDDYANVFKKSVLDQPEQATTLVDLEIRRTIIKQLLKMKVEQPVQRFLIVSSTHESGLAFKKLSFDQIITELIFWGEFPDTPQELIERLWQACVKDDSDGMRKAVWHLALQAPSLKIEIFERIKPSDPLLSKYSPEMYANKNWPEYFIRIHKFNRGEDYAGIY